MTILAPIIVALFARLLSDGYRVIDQYLITNILTLVRGFEFAIVLMAAAVFMLMAVGIAMRQARKLPRSYSIESFDLDGRHATIDGLRYTCSTYEVAESYARYYRQTFDRQYTFKVVGSVERIEYKFGNEVRNR